MWSRRVVGLLIALPVGIYSAVRQDRLRLGPRGLAPGLVGRDVRWSTIEAATGIDEATFDRLKHQLDAADGGAIHCN